MGHMAPQVCKGRACYLHTGSVPRNKEDGLCPGRLQNRSESIPFSFEMGGKKFLWKCWNFSGFSFVLSCFTMDMYRVLKNN